MCACRLNKLNEEENETATISSFLHVTKKFLFNILKTKSLKIEKKSSIEAQSEDHAQVHKTSESYAAINFSGAHPPPPRATAGHLLTLSVPGVGQSQFYCGPGGWALAYPRAFDTYVFGREISLSGRTRPLSKTVACPSGTRKTCRCF